MIKWTLRLLFGFWLVHYAIYLLPSRAEWEQEHSRATANGKIFCSDSYALYIWEGIHAGHYIPCEYFDQYNYLLKEDPVAAQAYLLKRFDK